MIDAKEIRDFVEGQIEGSDLLLVDVRVNPGNLIEVEIDSDSPVSIEECERLTRAIEEAFDRDKEDYTLEVGSAGITTPFKVKRQYQKNIGREVEVIATNGKKYNGILKSVDDEGFSIESKEKVKKPEAKRPVVEMVEHRFPFAEVKQTKHILKF